MVYRQTDRERQRYIVYEGNDPVPTFKKLYGVMGEAKVGLQIHSNKVLKVNSAGVNSVKAAIALTSGSRSVKVGTSIKDAKNLHNKQKIKLKK